MSKNAIYKIQQISDSSYVMSHYGRCFTPTRSICSRESRAPSYLNTVVGLPITGMADVAMTQDWELIRCRMNKILAKHFMDPADVVMPKNETESVAVKKDEPDAEYL